MRDGDPPCCCGDAAACCGLAAACFFFLCCRGGGGSGAAPCCCCTAESACDRAAVAICCCVARCCCAASVCSCAASVCSRVASACSCVASRSCCASSCCCSAASRCCASSCCCCCALSFCRSEETSFQSARLFSKLANSLPDMTSYGIGAPSRYCDPLAVVTMEPSSAAASADSSVSRLLPSSQRGSSCTRPRRSRYTPSPCCSGLTTYHSSSRRMPVCKCDLRPSDVSRVGVGALCASATGFLN